MTEDKKLLNFEEWIEQLPVQTLTDELKQDILDAHTYELFKAYTDIKENDDVLYKFYKQEALRGWKWSIFRAGKWKGMGSHWFTILGFNFYFRYGKDMQKGFYIPSTNLNILISNYHKK